MLKIMVVAFGLTAILIGAWMRRMGIKATSWPAVDGEIIESRLEPDPHDADKRVVIKYRYTVHGRAYESRQISYTGHSAAATAKQRLVERYPVGLRLPIYYDPERPQSAIIERELTPTWLWLLATGASFVCLGVLFLP